MLQTNILFFLPYSYQLPKGNVREKNIKLHSRVRIFSSLTEDLIGCLPELLWSMLNLCLYPWYRGEKNCSKLFSGIDSHVSHFVSEDLGWVLATHMLDNLPRWFWLHLVLETCASLLWKMSIKWLLINYWLLILTENCPPFTDSFMVFSSKSL